MSASPAGLAAIRIELAPGVSYDDGRISDAVRGKEWPVNGAAAAIVRRLPATLAELEVAVTATGIPAPVAREHVRRFVELLNRRYLVNARRPRGGLVREHVARLQVALLAGRWTGQPFPNRRATIDTSTYPRLIGSAARALAPAAARLSVLSTAVLSLVLAALGVRDLTAAVVLGVSLGVGALVHEIGHALLLRGVPSAVTSHGPRPAVLHRHVPGRRGALVTAAGPMAGVLLGAALLVPAATFSLGWLALVAIVSASQAAGFTCLSADGRKLCALH